MPERQLACYVKKVIIIYSMTLLSACLDDDSSSTGSNDYTQDLEHIYTYQPKAALIDAQVNPADCVDDSQYCTIQQLPFIKLSFEQPSIENIMSRVVVSHDWMGNRFKALLTRLPDEILTLMGSVTAIVIADNIRPSFYWTGSGAIYLDPAYLWLTNEEKQTISKDEDIRGGYGSNLKYDFFHRFIKDGQYAYSSYALDSTEERTLDEIEIPMASLLFHELAHANDFVPQSLISQFDITLTVNDAVNQFASSQLNQRLKVDQPLTETELFTQAAVLYHGKEASEQDLSSTATQLGLLMEGEGANHLYSYSTAAEDVAMLFQATMLKYKYGIDMDSAFVEKPTLESVYCNDYVVAWGVRNRIANPLVKPRAEFVSQELLSELDLTSFYQNLSNEQYFPAQTTWCNTSLSNITESADSLSKQGRSDNRYQIQIDHHHGSLKTK